ncbi:IS66 family transposase [Paraburkholderia terricola]|uniref:IS66 family transposase n=1 Tax=Paraburkholderia terricola TaxID=169427 RepID=UPI0035B4FDA6
MLQADAFAGYADLYLGGQICEAACMAHVESYMIGTPFGHRRSRARHLSASAHSIASKSTFVASRLKNDGAFVRRGLCRCLKTSGDGLRRRVSHSKASQYSLNRWPALVYYCSNGQAEIDNLIAERALRG